MGQFNVSLTVYAHNGDDVRQADALVDTDAAGQMGQTRPPRAAVSFSFSP
jgi:hypothetical protein